MKRDAAIAISKIVEEHLGRDVFWDGPYRIEEASRHASIGATESTQIAYSEFAARHHGDRFFVCFDFVVLYSKGRSEGYLPKSILVIGDGGAIEWFDLNRPILEGCVRPERSGAVNTTIVEQAPASPEVPQGRPD